MKLWRMFHRAAPPAEPAIDWVLPGALAIGPAPSARFLPHLLARRIAVILSLCDETERSLPPELSDRFCCLRVPLPDSRYARPMEIGELGEAMELIHWYLQKQQPVYVHCLAGIERSPTVCLAYLCQCCQMDLLDALAWVTHVHDRSRPTSAQLEAVRQYLRQTPPRLG